MKTAAIIAEYNPFHKGHAYQIEKTRHDTGADYVIAIMSPDFVQRSHPAIMDKHVRTRLALLGGADLVLELPVAAATGSAEFFARGAVSILGALGVVDVLSFGCEVPDTDKMMFAAKVLNEEPQAYKDALHKQLSAGASFPAARSEALLHVLPPQEQSSSAVYEQIMSSPNNILALEYIRALLSLNTTIKPFAIKRFGNDYHSLETDSVSFASAAAVRKLIRDAEENNSLRLSSQPSLQPSAQLSSQHSAELSSQHLRQQIPAPLLAPMQTALDLYGLPSMERFDLLVRYALTEASASGTLTSFLDLSDELASRIESRLTSYESFDQFTDLLSARNFPASRVRRALLHVLLKIRTEEALQAHTKFAAPYARILGFRRSCGDLMHTLKKSCDIPVITKPSAAPQLLDGPALSAFKQDIYASTIYGMLFPGLKKENEYTRSPIIIE